MKLVVYVTVLIIGVVKAQVLRLECANISLVQDLDIERLAGEWYEISRTPNPWEEGACTQINQMPIKNGQSLLMRWEEVLHMDQGPVYKYAISTGDSPIDDVASKLSLNFLFPPLPFSTPYHVIDTDYDNYFVAYTCHRFFFDDGFLSDLEIYTEYVWIMGRKRYLDTGIIASKTKMLEDGDVNVSWMERVDQSKCNDLYGAIRNKEGENWKEYGAEMIKTQESSLEADNDN